MCLGTIEDRAYIISGFRYQPDSQKYVEADAYQFDFASNTFSRLLGTETQAYNPKKGLEAGSGYTFPVRRSAFCWTDQSDNLFVFGGINEAYVQNLWASNLYNDVWLYRKDSSFWTWIEGQSGSNPSKSNSYPNGRHSVIGGVDSNTNL
jgi:N-acetylneuraminic acid mutarotase